MGTNDARGGAPSIIVDRLIAPLKAAAWPTKSGFTLPKTGDGGPASAICAPPSASAPGAAAPSAIAAVGGGAEASGLLLVVFRDMKTKASARHSRASRTRVPRTAPATSFAGRACASAATPAAPPAPDPVALHVDSVLALALALALIEAVREGVPAGEKDCEPDVEEAVGVADDNDVGVLDADRLRLFDRLACDCVALLVPLPLMVTGGVGPAVPEHDDVRVASGDDAAVGDDVAVVDDDNAAVAEAVGTTLGVAEVVCEVVEVEDVGVVVRDASPVADAVAVIVLVSVDVIVAVDKLEPDAALLALTVDDAVIVIVMVVEKLVVTLAVDIAVDVDVTVVETVAEDAGVTDWLGVLDAIALAVAVGVPDWVGTRVLVTVAVVDTVCDDDDVGDIVGVADDTALVVLDAVLDAVVAVLDVGLRVALPDAVDVLVAVAVLLCDARLLNVDDGVIVHVAVPLLVAVTDHETVGDIELDVDVDTVEVPVVDGVGRREGVKLDVWEDVAVALDVWDVALSDGVGLGVEDAPKDPLVVGVVHGAGGGGNIPGSYGGKATPLND